MGRGDLGRFEQKSSIDQHSQRRRVKTGATGTVNEQECVAVTLLKTFCLIHQTFEGDVERRAGKVRVSRCDLV